MTKKELTIDDLQVLPPTAEQRKRADKWQVIDFKIGDIVIFDWYERGTGKRLAKTGEIVYMSKVDCTVNVKCHFSGMVVNVGKEILRLIYESSQF